MSSRKLPRSSSSPSPDRDQDPQQQARSKKDPWTGEEDEVLLKLVGQLGYRWRDIATTINRRYGFEKRIGKQCRERFLNHLKGGLKNSPWTPEEDELLRQNQKLFGNKWASIAAAMPGRPENQVKNRWNAANFNKHSPAPILTPPPPPASSRIDKHPRLSFFDQSTPPPNTPSAHSANAYWQAQAMAFPPTMFFPQYFAQQQQVHQVPIQHHQPLFAPLVEALEMGNPEAITPPSMGMERFPSGASPPSSCHDLFEALKTDTELPYPFNTA
ncbi:hypothetical protein BASA81_003409 [Batrachochytrium salamandrivorans]|nr:hypothetical protein BASA81_003409 [Batrachochytrium salamandrivorans]